MRGGMQVDQHRRSRHAGQRGRHAGDGASHQIAAWPHRQGERPAAPPDRDNDAGENEDRDADDGAHRDRVGIAERDEPERQPDGRAEPETQ